MRSRRLPRRRNPEWSWDVLDELWPRLRAVAPERLMPIPTVTQVSVQTNPRRRNPQVLEYGAGDYGVVMPTGDPRWVFKLTRDKSEASLINALRKGGLKCSLAGISRYSTIYDTGLKIGSRMSSGRIYAVWRESAEVAGMHVWTALNKTPRRVMADQARTRIILALESLKNSDDDDRQLYDFKEWLFRCEAALRDWRQNPLLMDTAEDLLELMKLGIVVTDTHLGNWGLVRRRPKLLTLIDPGLVKFVTPVAQDLASDIPRL